MKKLSENLTFLLEQRKITANELARCTGVHQPVIHKIIKEKTNNPSILTLISIAKFFSISLDQLVGNEPLPKTVISDNSQQSTFSQQNKQFFTNIPIIQWNEIKEWLKYNNTQISNDFIAIEKNVYKHAFALRISNLNSNITDPRFHENSIIIVDPKIEYKNRDYVVVSHNENVNPIFLLRQLLIDGAKKYLKPLNSEAETQEIKKNEEILGVVIEARHHYVQLKSK